MGRTVIGKKDPVVAVGPAADNIGSDRFEDLLGQGQGGRQIVFSIPKDQLSGSKVDIIQCD